MLLQKNVARVDVKVAKSSNKMAKLATLGCRWDRKLDPSNLQMATPTITRRNKWIGQRYLNAYIFYDVANSYEFIRTHPYDLVRFGVPSVSGSGDLKRGKRKYVGYIYIKQTSINKISKAVLATSVPVVAQYSTVGGSKRVSWDFTGNTSCTTVRRAISHLVIIGL